MKLITCTLVAAALLACSSAALAQDQDQESVADAARKAQAAKKTEPQAAKVYTNDDISSLKGDVSVVGEEPAPPPAQAAAPAAAAGQTAPVKKDETYFRNAFAAARRTLADDERELDVLQREYGLKQEQYYSDPNQALREQTDRKDLNDTKAEIDDKTAKVEKDKQAISDLEDDLRKSGGEPGWADPPSTPSSSSDTGSSDNSSSGAGSSDTNTTTSTSGATTPASSTPSTPAQ